MLLLHSLVNVYYISLNIYPPFQYLASAERSQLAGSLQMTDSQVIEIKIKSRDKKKQVIIYPSSVIQCIISTHNIHTQVYIYSYINMCIINLFIGENMVSKQKNEVEVSETEY